MKHLLATIYFLFFLSQLNVSGSDRNINFSERATQWADSVYQTLDLELRVAQILMPVVTDEQFFKNFPRELPQPGFILGSYDLIVSNLPTHNMPLSTLYVPDIREGFNIGNSSLPYPNEKTITLLEPADRKPLLEILHQRLNESNIRAYYASYKCSYSWHNGSIPNQEKSPSKDIVWNNKQGEGVVGMRAFKMPKQIIGLLSSHLPRIYKEQGVLSRLPMLSVKTGRDLPVTEISVEDILGEGIIIMTDDYEKDHRQLVNAFSDRWLNIQDLKKTCVSVLAFKYDIFYNGDKSGDDNIKKNNFEIIRNAYEKAVVLIQPEAEGPLPLADLDVNVGFLSQGDVDFEIFRQMAANYINVEFRELDPLDYNLIFWLVSEENMVELSYKEQLFALRERYKKAKIVMVYAGNPESLFFIDVLNFPDALLLTPLKNQFSWSVLAQAAFNGIEIKRRNSDEIFAGKLAKHIREIDVLRLKFGIPQEVGFNYDKLQQIDRIVEDAIKKEAIPGAQVLIARNGVVVWQKSYGWHTYDRKRLVNNTDIYDLASISKIAATLPVAMRLYDDGRWRLSDNISAFIPEADTTNKKDITIRQLLVHESGFPAFIPFYTETIDKKKLNGNLYSNRRTATHSIRVEERLFMNRAATYRDDLYRKIPDLEYSIAVAGNLYLRNDYIDSMYVKMLNARLNAPVYRYSDVNFLLLQRILENLSGETLDKLAENQFYKSIGASSLQFNPWKNNILERVVPTENDVSFRYQLLHGYVHDQGAAMFGGVAGHAGLFGNANDLAKLMQMYLNNGVYGGRRYLNHETISFFSAKQNNTSRRALGFDKPEFDPDKISPSSKQASALSYGHSGFTGTIVWVDPQYNLIYIFLSNRIHPNAYNRKLMELNVRTKIHDVIYESLMPEKNR